MFVSQEEEYFKVESITSEMNEENKLCVKEEYFDGCGLESMSDDEFFCHA